jgi:hypothetical protein
VRIARLPECGRYPDAIVSDFRLSASAMALKPLGASITTQRHHTSDDHPVMPRPELHYQLRLPLLPSQCRALARGLAILLEKLPNS